MTCAEVIVGITLTRFNESSLGHHSVIHGLRAQHNKDLLFNVGGITLGNSGVGLFVCSPIELWSYQKKSSWFQAEVVCLLDMSLALTTKVVNLYGQFY